MRLRLSEMIPIEMSRYKIGALHRNFISNKGSNLYIIWAVEGRLYLTAPSLFETSICLRGAEKDDGWFFVHVEFLINVGGDITSTQGR